MTPRKYDEKDHDGVVVPDVQQQEQEQERLNCDYLVVGAGTSGMSFTDTILSEDPKATLIVVDRNERPGGHWVHAYPFCRIHQTNCNYGVNSMTLGKNISKKGIERYDVRDRSTAQEILEYYQRVREKFEATGRVKFFFGAEYKEFDASRGVHKIVADENKSGETNIVEVRCRRKLVTVENNVVVPSMREPTIPVHEAASFVSVNALPESLGSGTFRNYVVFGCGKTGADAIVHLLRDGGVDPSRITWIVSRDVWYFLREGLEDFYATNDTISIPTLECGSVEDIYLGWEERGLLGRLDRSTIPKVFKGPTMDNAELELMRSVEKIVRMGRALSVEQHTIVLEKGSIDYDPDTTLLVDCMVDAFFGYDTPNNYSIFEPGHIKLGPTTFIFNPSFSAAHIAFVECALGENNDDAKNDCLYHIPQDKPNVASKPETFIGVFYLQLKNTDKLMKIPGGRKFFLNSRTNLSAPKHHKGGMLRFLWYAFGPKQMMKKSKRIEKKIDSKGYSDLDHCFGAETVGTVEIAF